MGIGGGFAHLDLKVCYSMIAMYKNIFLLVLV